MASKLQRSKKRRAKRKALLPANPTLPPNIRKGLHLRLEAAECEANGAYALADKLTAMAAEAEHTLPRSEGGKCGACCAGRHADCSGCSRGLCS